MPSKALTKSSGVPEVFEWTEPRKKALKLVLRGMFISDIAENVGVSRMTLQRWVKNPVFIEKMQQRLNERQTANALKHSYFTSKHTNDVMERLSTTMSRLKRAQLHPKRGLRNWELQGGLLDHMEKLSKEFERMRNQTRLDSGQATSVSKHTSTSMVLHGGKVQHSHEAGASFRDAMEKYKNEIVINPNDSPTQQMLDATVQVLQGTDYLEQLALDEGAPVTDIK